MHPNSFYSVLSAYRRYLKTAGVDNIPIQQIKLSARSIAEYGRISRATVSNVIKELGGFEREPEGYRVTKDFSWADLKKLSESGAKEEALKKWWAGRPVIIEEPTPTNSENGLSADERTLIQDYRTATKNAKEIVKDLAERAARSSKVWETVQQHRDPAPYIEGVLEAMREKDWLRASKLAMALEIIAKSTN